MGIGNEVAKGLRSFLAHLLNHLRSLEVMGTARLYEEEYWLGYLFQGLQLFLESDFWEQAHNSTPFHVAED